MTGVVAVEVGGMGDGKWVETMAVGLESLIVEI